MTDEEKKERQRIYWRRWRERHPDKSREYVEKWKNSNPDKLAQNAVHLEKKFKIKKEGFRCTIGTLNRFLLTTCYIEGKVTLVRTTLESMKSIRQAMLTDIRAWIESQDMWDKKQRIFIVDTPSYDDTVKTKVNVISFQYTMLRRGVWNTNGLVKQWHELHKGLEPFVEHHYQVIKKAVEDNGTRMINKLDKLEDAPSLADEGLTISPTAEP